MGLLWGSGYVDWVWLASQPCLAHRHAPAQVTRSQHLPLPPLQSGMLRALVLDTSFVEYIAAPDCDLMVVGQQFNLFDQAVAFPR